MLYLQENFFEKRTSLGALLLPHPYFIPSSYYCYLKVVCEYIQSTHWHCPWLLTWSDIKKRMKLTAMRARMFSLSVACRLRHGSGSTLDEVPLIFIDVAITTFM